MKPEDELLNYCPVDLSSEIVSIAILSKHGLLLGWEVEIPNLGKLLRFLGGCESSSQKNYSQLRLN